MENAPEKLQDFIDDLKNVRRDNSEILQREAEWAKTLDGLQSKAIERHKEVTGTEYH